MDILQYLMLIQPFLGREISFLSRTDPTQGSMTSKEEPKAQQQMYVIHGRLVSMKRKHKGLPSRFEFYEEQSISSHTVSLLVWYLGLTYSHSRQAVPAPCGKPAELFSRSHFSFCIDVCCWVITTWGEHPPSCSCNPTYFAKGSQASTRPLS